MTEVTDEAIGDQVRALLHAILRKTDFLGCYELLSQVPCVKVVGGSLTMIDVDVQGRVARSAVPDGPLPVAAAVDVTPESAVGELLVWADDGRLSALEYAWYTDEPPDALPLPEQVNIALR